MPRTVEPAVFLIAKTVTIPENVRTWVESLGVENRFTQALLDISKTEAERLIELCGRRCYMSFQPGLNPNVSKIRADIGQYIENILSSAHGSVLEHVWFTFAIENVSRVFTGEMNRHRAGTAISEGSMRYIRYTDIPYWTPGMFQGDSVKQQLTRLVLEKAFTEAEKNYHALCEIWADELAPASSFHKKKELTSAMRRIIPMGVATGGAWSGNVRALRHIFQMRCSPAAEEEILLVATAMLSVMREAEPTIFGDFSTDEHGFSKPKYSKV